MPEPLERHFANMDRLVALERDLAEARRERDAARRELADLDLVLPVACGSRVDAARTLVAERDSYQRAAHTAAEALGRMMGERDAAREERKRMRAERDEIDGDKCKLSLVLRDLRDEAEAARAALRECATRLHDLLANPVDRLMEPPEVTRLRVTWETVSAGVDLERALADTRAAAEAYRARVRAEALADVLRVLNLRGDAVTTTPADTAPVLAAVNENSRLVRAKVRREVLREAADTVAAEGWAFAFADWLRAMADEEGKR